MSENATSPIMPPPQKSDLTTRADAIRRRVLITVVSISLIHISFQAWRVASMYLRFYEDPFLIANDWLGPIILHAMAGYVVPASVYLFLGTVHHRWVFLSAVFLFGFPFTKLIPAIFFGLPLYVGLNLAAIIVLLFLSLRKREAPFPIHGSKRHP